MKVLTISVAAYNVQDYIEQLLDSVIKADRNEELEVLVINDGSKDETAYIVSKYAEKYPYTIKLIDKENGGHGSTINKGIELASGRYFKIVDGDDWVDSNGLATLVDYLRYAKEDMVLTDYREVYERTGTYRDRTDAMNGARAVMAKGEVVDFCRIADKSERIQMHMITFATRLLQNRNIRVDEHCFYVDTEYVFFTLPYIRTASYQDIMVYCYRLGRPGQSMTSQSLRKHRNNHIKVNEALLNSYKENSGNVSIEVRKHMNTMLGEVTMLTYRILLSMPYKPEFGKQIERIDSMLKDVSPDLYERMTDAWLNSFRNKNYKRYLFTWIRVKLLALKEHL